MSDNLSESFHQWLVAIRRELHQFPELQYQEEKTGAKICEVLEYLKIPFQKGIGKTGIIARLCAERKGPVLAFRADMDALPLEEANDVPYKSQYQGVMHACGHDAHVTIALGVARWLLEKDWPRKGAGEILFIFQPAEEGGGGAKIMLESGAFDADRVEAVFAGHMYPEFPAGHVEIAPEVVNAAVSRIVIRLKGKGGHGAHPHQTQDPIVAGAHLVTQLQTIISRNLPASENAVLTIGRFQAGTASNIIPGEALLEGTLRTLKPSVCQLISERTDALIRGVETAFDLSASFEVIEGYPVLTNHPELAEYMMSCADGLLGADAVHRGYPRMGAEDFSYFSEKWGGVMVGLGCHDSRKGFQHGLHSPHFDIDENVLDVGTRLFGNALMHYAERSCRTGAGL